MQRIISFSPAQKIILGLIFVAISIGMFNLAFAASTGTALPKADGNYVQWTPSTGTTHYTMVNEATCNGATNYNSTTVVGNRDSYVISTSSIPNGATITQIDIKPCASRSGTGGGTSVLNVFYRFAGVDSTDAGAYSFTTGNTPAEQATTSFSGLSFLQTATTSLEVGGIYSSGTKGLRLSRIAAFVTYTTLAAPSGLSATATTTSAIATSWTDNATNESGYLLERSTNAINWSNIATTSPNISSYYDTGLSTGTGYYYRVRAFNFGGNTAYSAVASATTTATPPTAPSVLSATASATNPTANLSWTDNSSDETNFEVLRSLDGTSFSHLSTTTANSVSYFDSGLASSTMYYYEVRSYNSGGYSAVSNTASTTTGMIPTAASGQILTSSTTALSIDVAWTDNSTNELNFRVEQSTTSPTSGFALVKNLSANSATTTYKPTFANTIYYFRVLTGNGYGTTTSEVASTTSASIPSAPSGLSLTNQSGTGTSTDVLLNWTDNSSNELAFRIERGTSTSTLTQIATTSPDVILYLDQSRPSGTFYYRLRAFNSVGNSAYTATASTTIP